MKKSLRKNIIAGLFLSLFCAALACRFNLPALQPVPTPTPQPTIPGPDQLLFNDPATASHFTALDQCIKDLTDADWRSTSYRLIGNFYEANWCTGRGARQDCQIAASTEGERDQHTLSLSTLFYSDSFPQVFGLNFNALWVPPAAGWGALFHFSEQGGNIVGEGWGVTFSQYNEASGEAERSISLGSQYEYKILETTLQVVSNATLREDLANHLNSAEAMRITGLTQLQMLDEKVTRSIQNHEIPGCDYSPYEGQGIPPVCNQRPMTAEEESVELQGAQEYFAAQTRLLNENYMAMYAAWLNAFPFETCWQ